MEGSSWFRHLTQEVFMETRAQDVLSICLIRVKGQLLSIKTEPELINHTTDTDLYTHRQVQTDRYRQVQTSARSSKQLPTRG